jgi:60 kDa SS-A/Ro ribonucleoprotein
MRGALHNKIDVDAFISYTDNENWAGYSHPAEAVRNYRQQRGIGSSAAWVTMTASHHQAADPRDARMLDVTGFDSGTPEILSQFINNEF